MPDLELIRTLRENISSDLTTLETLVDSFFSDSCNVLDSELDEEIMTWARSRTLKRELENFTYELRRNYDDLDGRSSAYETEDIETVEGVDVEEEIIERHAFRLATFISDWTSKFESLTARVAIGNQLGRVKQTAANAWSSFAKHLKAIIQGISGALWRLLSHALKLKEWSIAGTITANVFGSGGSAEIKLVFQPSSSKSATVP